MAIEVEAVYENGVLKLGRPVPLTEQQRARITIHDGQSSAKQSYGLIGWMGDPEILRQIAQDPEFGVEEGRYPGPAVEELAAVTQIHSVDPAGVEPALPARQAGVVPLDHRPAAPTLCQTMTRFRRFARGGQI